MNEEEVKNYYIACWNLEDTWIHYWVSVYTIKKIIWDFRIQWKKNKWKRNKWFDLTCRSVNRLLAIRDERMKRKWLVPKVNESRGEYLKEVERQNKIQEKRSKHYGLDKDYNKKILREYNIYL